MASFFNTSFLLLLCLSAASCLTIHPDSHPNLDSTESSPFFESQPDIKSTNLEKLQQLLTGMWIQANLTAPTTVFACLDENVSELTVNMIGLTLDLFQKGQFDTLHQNLTSFMRAFPSTTLTCLKKNSEVAQLLNATGIGSEPNSVRMSQLGVYVATHQLQIKTYVSLARISFQYGDLRDIGKTFVKVLQDAFTASKKNKNLEL